MARQTGIFTKLRMDILLAKKAVLTSLELQMILRFKERVKTDLNSAEPEKAENWCEAPSGFFC